MPGKPPSNHPVRAKKFLGQHFLKDENVAQKIAAILKAGSPAKVLEIGPGTGVLTQFLLKEEIELTVMELDRESVAYLKDGFLKTHLQLQHRNFQIIEADFLKYDLSSLFGGDEFSIIGNFPYNISSQILFKTLDNRHRIPLFGGMFQKEVAQRICADPGSKVYGILSVLTQAFYKAEYLFTVPPGVFLPPPKVESGVLKLSRKTVYRLDCDEELFFTVVKKAFQQRRKTLRNSLKSLGVDEQLRQSPLFEKRPEQLAVEEFITLTQLIKESSV